MSNDRNYPFSRGSIFAISDKIDSFLRESNAIEREYSDEALDASLVAWNYAVDNYDDFGMEYVCGIHERLMHRLNPKIAGKLRDQNVCIGRRDNCGVFFATRTFEAKGNKQRLKKWCKKYRVVGDLDEIKEAHIDFEMIHPFLDGNGRTGRILYNAHRVGAGFDIRVFYEAKKFEYYEWFLDRQRKEDLAKS